MAYKLKEETKQWEPIPGVPWHDLTEAEFQAAQEQYDKQFPDQPGSLHRWFERVREEEIDNDND